MYGTAVKRADLGCWEDPGIEWIRLVRENRWRLIKYLDLQGSGHSWVGLPLQNM